MQITETIAKTYGTQLNESELDWQAAMAGAGRNLTALAEATSAGRVEITTTVELFGYALTGISQLLEAGATFQRLHTRVSAIARFNGLDPTSWGQSGGPRAAAETDNVVALAAERAAA